MQSILSRVIVDDSMLTVKVLPHYFGAYLAIATIVDILTIAYFWITR